MSTYRVSSLQRWPVRLVCTCRRRSGGGGGGGGCSKWRRSGIFGCCFASSSSRLLVGGVERVFVDELLVAARVVLDDDRARGRVLDRSCGRVAGRQCLDWCCLVWRLSRCRLNDTA